MQGLIEYTAQKAPQYFLIRDGIFGNADVIWRMMDVVKNTVTLDKGFEDSIKTLVKENNFDAYSDTDSLFDFLYRFVKGDTEYFEGVTYLQDIQGRTESIKDARTTLRDGYGDCDDNAILNASILAVLGYEPVFVAAKYPEQDSYSHIYTVTYVDGKRYVFDTTIPDGHLNSEAQGMEIREFPVFGNYSETNGVAGIVRNLKYVIKETQKNARHAAPFLAGFLPLGFFEKMATSQLFGSATPTQESINAIGSELSGKLTNIIIELQNGRITQQQALSQGARAYSAIYSFVRTNELDEQNFIAIEKQLKKKLDYIKNFSSGQIAANAGITNGQLILIGIIGLGVFYLVKNNN